MRLLAQIISLVFHPFVVALAAIVIALEAATGDLVKALWLGVIGSLFVILPGALYTLNRFIKNPKLADFSIRQNRFGAYELTLGLGLLVLLALIALNAPKILISCLLAGLLTLGVLTILNFKTKASLHLAALGAAAAALFFISPWAGLSAAILALPVGWSRIYLKEHTLGQVLLGWLAAFASAAIVFAIF